MQAGVRHGQQHGGLRFRSRLSRIAWLLVLLTPGWSHAATAEEVAVPDAAVVGSIADEPSDESAYSKKVRCISSRSIRGQERVGRKYIAFEMRRGVVMLNHLRSACTGIGIDSTLAVESTFEGRLCALDRVELLQRGAFFRADVFGRPGGQAIGHCRLGEFEKINEDQLAALKQSLAMSEARDAARPGRTEATKKEQTE